MKKTTALIAVLLLSVAARAIELSLEENRGERGSVGYVDMQRLFTSSPDAQRAKEGFEDLVRQAEERVNLRKAELLKLRQELDTTRVERDALAKSMALAPVPLPVQHPIPVPLPGAPLGVSTAAASVAVSTAAPAPASLFGGSHAAVAVSTAPAAPAAIPFAAAPAVAVSTTAPAPASLFGGSHAAVAVSTAPAAPAVAVSTAAAVPAPLPRELALPGMSTVSYAPSAPPAAPAATAAAPAATPVRSSATAVASAASAASAAASTAAAVSPAAIVLSTKTVQSAQVPVVSSSAAASAATMFPMPGATPVVAQAPAGPSPAQRLLEFDAKIIGVQADIAHKESDLMHEHDDADRGLLDVESRKTDQVLARLYRAVSEVARREGVSVVVDKTSILYGHQAVDLTDKVLKYLKETPATPAEAP
jgi:Skp family chaperone for outer membrane proteins